MQFSHVATRVPAQTAADPLGVQNSINSIKNQLNFEVTFKCHFEPLYSPTWLQLSPNLASKSPSQTGLKTMLKFNILKSLSTLPMRNASFCFSQGLPKRVKTHSKTTFYTSAFSTSEKQPPSFDFAPTWLPLGPPKVPPRVLQGLLKTTLGSILGNLSCKFQFLASQGVPPGPIFSILAQCLMVFKAGFVLNVAPTPSPNGACVGPIAFATTLDFQLLSVTIIFH